MFLKRFSLALVVCFALLSLFTPRFEPVRIVETTALIASRPWEGLLSMLAPKTSGSDPYRSEAGSWDRSQSSRLWWQPIFDRSAIGNDDILLGGRVVPPSRRTATRIMVDMGPDPPVQRDDPVTCGRVLVGFVRSRQANGLVEVSLLGDRDSRSVAAEVGEAIAGEKIYFPIGGGDDAQGNLPIKFPSTRFGLVSGSEVLTSSGHRSAYAGAPLPAGLSLGTVSADRSRNQLASGQAVVLPALRVDDLRRIAVLVPAGRTGVEGRAPVPELQLYSIPVEFHLPPGFLREWSFGRLSSGLEAGLDVGDFIVKGHFLAGRIAAAGLLTCRTSIFLLPGTVTEVARLDRTGIERCRLRVLARSGDVCTVEAEPALLDLEKGSPLYFPDEPCAGTEFYPVCQVLDRLEGETFTVRCPDLAGDDSSFCLGFRR